MQPLYPDLGVVYEAKLAVLQALDHLPLDYLIRNKVVLLDCCLPRGFYIILESSPTNTPCAPPQGKLRGTG